MSGAARVLDLCGGLLVRLLRGCRRRDDRHRHRHRRRWGRQRWAGRRRRRDEGWRWWRWGRWQDHRSGLAFGLALVVGAHQNPPSSRSGSLASRVADQQCRRRARATAARVRLQRAVGAARSRVAFCFSGVHIRAASGIPLTYEATESDKRSLRLLLRLDSQSDGRSVLPDRRWCRDAGPPPPAVRRSGEGERLHAR
jgi:hypothetical protein